MREDDDSIVEVFPYEALVINDASKIGAIESLSLILNPSKTLWLQTKFPVLSQNHISKGTKYSLVQVRRLISKIWIIGQFSRKI